MISGILFDKDGTLFDFNATWGAWAQGMLADEAKGDAEVLDRLAEVLGYDQASRSFLPGSIVIAETATTIADAMLTVIDDDKAALVARMDAKASMAPQVEAVPLRAFFKDLKARNLKLGIATNDTEAPARQHLSRAGVEHVFDFIAGSDSGYGGKPDIGQLRGFCETVNLPAERCAMIGDSLHDLRAGRAAGMTTVGVLTGPAAARDLAPCADVILNSIGDLPGWLDRVKRERHRMS